MEHGAYAGLAVHADTIGVAGAGADQGEPLRRVRHPCRALRC